MNSTENFIIFR